MKILLVDDEKMVLSLLRECVENVLPDAEIFPFVKAREALDFAVSSRIDIAFLDINMGAIDGISMAKQLQEFNPKTNIIFCTGYSDYMSDALKMYCSGYLLKPINEDDVREAVEHLRYPIETPKKKIVINCMNGIEVFCNNKPVSFGYKKTKELIAYLIYKNGAACSTLDIIAALFGDEVNRSYFNRLRADLIDSLTKLGASDIIRTGYGSIGINRNMISCDYFDFLDGKLPNADPNSFIEQFLFISENK